MQISWTDQAKKDFHQIFDFLESNSPAYADAFFDRIKEIIIKIEQFPHIGRIVPEKQNDNIRELFWKKYRIIYFLKDAFNIEILTILTNSQQFHSH